MAENFEYISRARLVYKDGLAAVTGDKFEFMEWSAVQEASWVWIRLSRRLALTDAEGRQMVVWQDGYTEAGELRLAIFQRVNDFLLPKTLKRIAAGKARLHERIAEWLDKYIDEASR